MGVRLTVKERSEQGGADKPQVLLLDDEIITLGRDKTCQVVLGQQAVSRAHARISRDGSLFFVEDLGSAYGTHVNGAKLPKGEKHLLKNGDLIAIAQFDVTFDRVAEDPKDSSDGHSVARKVVKDVMRGLASGSEVPYLRVMSGPNEGQRIELSDAAEYIIGRDESADIIFKDDLVSRKHAKIRRDWSGTHVEDLGSRNGIKVNKKRVAQKTLKDRDEVEVGGFRLLFIDPSEVREAPVVLPEEKKEDDDEATSAVKEDEVAAAPEGTAAAAPGEEGALEEEPIPEESVPEEEEEAAPDDEGGGDDDAPMDEPEGDESEDGDYDEDDEGGAAEGPGGLDKQTYVVLGVVGALALVAIVFVVMILVGA
jgi:pSer/pThr/pTyr-binding forkhead associated (FHA) protein